MAKIIDAHFADEAKPFTVGPGKTVEEIVRACNIPKGIWSNVVIILNGTEVVRSEWCNVFPNEADVLSVHVVPLGSDGKQVLRLVAVIAIAIAAPGLGAKLAASSFGTTVGLSATVATAGITVLGTLAVSALIPPPTIRPNVPGGSATSNAYFLSGQSNRARPYEIVPITYGKHKMFANLASSPHIFSAGTSSIFEAVYDWGLGSYSIGELFVGETPFDMFKNRGYKNHVFRPTPVSNSPNSAFNPVDLEIYAFPIKSADLAIGLNDVGDNGSSRTSGKCHTAVVELTFPQGLVYFDDAGETQSNWVRYRIGYKPAASVDYIPLPSGTRGFTGNDHLSFSGITGPAPPPDEADYTPDITSDTRDVFAGEPMVVMVKFRRGVGYPGNGVEGGGKFDRPKESFYWINVDTGERYQCKSTVNGLSPGEYDPSEWAYNQEPVPSYQYSVNYDQPNAGTMVYNANVKGDTRYQFEFIAPDAAGRYRLEMDLSEWWTDEYGAVGSVRCADPADSDRFIEWYNGSSSPVVVSVPVSVPAEQLFNRASGAPITYIQCKVQSDSDSGPWQEVTSREYFIIYKDVPYTYNDDLQRSYVRDSIFGDSVSVESVSVDASVFLQYSAYEYFAVVEQSADRLISEGVLQVISIDIRRNSQRAFFDPGPDWGGGTVPDYDATGTLFSVYGSEATTGKLSIVIPMPSVGDYDLKVERIGEAKVPGEDTRYVDSSSWTRLSSRGLPDESAVLNLQHRHTLTEISFEANESIAGNVQQISTILTSALRTWKAGAWNPPALYDANGVACYDNPAWIVADILLGFSIQNKRAPRSHLDHCGWLLPEQLNLDSIYQFAEHCNQTVTYQTSSGTATRKRYTTNMVMASDAPIIETAQNILGQCRAQLIIDQAGKISIMRDEERTTPRQLFTPSNSWDFSGSRAFTEIPHCFNVQFTSPELGWQLATVQVYRPGYNADGANGEAVASVFEDLNTVGITNSHQAQLYGAYMLAQAVIRSETFTLTTDVENLVCQRGDLVEVAHDAPLMGGRSAVITGNENGWLSVSETFDGLTADSDTYTLRTNDGTVVYGSVVAISGNQIQIANQSLADVGGLIVVGPSNSVTERYLIQSIRPKPDLTAEISLVKYDERVYEVDDGDFPVWEPNFNQNISTGGSYVAFGATGFSSLIYREREPYTEATFSWQVSPDDDSVAGFFIEYQTAGGPRRKLDYVAGSTRTFTHIYESRDTAWGATSVYYITPYSSLGYKGREGQIVLAKRTDTTPPTVSGFAAEFTLTGNTRLSWDDATDPDIQAYSIYYKPDPINPGYGGEKIAQPSYEKTEWLLEGAREGLYWIIATDTSGLNSNPSYAGSFDIVTYPTPGLVDPFWIDVYEDRVGGMLHWALLDDPTISSYTLYQSYEPAEFDIERATRLATVGASVDQLAVERPFGAFWIVAKNIYGVTGPANRIVEYYRIPAKVQNFRLYVEQNVGVLRWDLLEDVYLDRYELRYSENPDSTNAEAAAPFGSASPTTNNMPSEKLEGAWFIRGVNIYGIAGPWSDTNSVVEGLAAINGKVTQVLRFIGRFPFSDATVSWQLQGSAALLEKYRVFFYPTEPTQAQTYKEPDEVVVDRPPVLVYEGPENRFTTTVSTTEDTGRQYGYFAILPISIYGTAGVTEYVDFEVIKDVTPPLPPERFFVNIVSNTNADLSWLASQSVDVDTYDLRYTPEYSSPRWEAAEHIATVGFNVTGYQTNARTGTYLIRATDTSGNVSDVVMQRTTVAELPDMNVIERIEEAPDWEGKKVYFIKDGSRLLMDGAPYTGGDDFGAEPYREATYYYHERLDLGSIYETRLTAKLQAYGQLSGSVMADWDTLAEIDPISGVEESADWDCWAEYRTGTQEDVIADWVNMAAQDPISGALASDWTEWRAFFAADVTARFLGFRIVARAYNPNAEVGVISGLIEVDMPDRYWTKADIPVGVGGASVSIDPPFKHLEAVAVTVDGNDYDVRAIVEDKKPSGFTVKLINQTNGAAVAGQVDVFCSGYGIERPEVI